jgi:Ca2+-transporting ATPase
VIQSAAIILFFVLLFRFIADLPNHPNVSPAEKGKEFVDILIVAVTVIVVAIPGERYSRSRKKAHDH